MNERNLHILIGRYEQCYDWLNEEPRREMDKWRIAKQFQNVWYSGWATSVPFSQMFAQASESAAHLLDRHFVTPTAGIIRMAEEYPENVEALFRNVLLADDYGDLYLRQKRLEGFIEGLEAIRRYSFASKWQYKQTMYSASCFATFLRPDDNYIVQPVEAEDFARLIEYDWDLGRDDRFRLDVYYGLCDEIVNALRRHRSLMEKYNSRLQDASYYYDNSLHLMAYDLISCCYRYNLGEGLECYDKKEVSRARRMELLEQENVRARARLILALDAKIHDLEVEAEELKSICLPGVEVVQPKYGVGTVIAQDRNQLTVAFPEETKNYIIHSRFNVRPTFDEDETVVQAMTRLGDLSEELVWYRRKLSSL